MSDLIDRQMVIDEINERQRKLIYCFGFENDAVKIMDIAKSIVSAIPSAQPPRPSGEWITDNLSELIYCGRCRNDAPVDTTGGGQYESNFCPYCGADMRGEQK